MTNESNTGRPKSRYTILANFPVYILSCTRSQVFRNTDGIHKLFQRAFFLGLRPDPCFTGYSYQFSEP